MGGTTGLKCLQWLIRGVQLGAAALILAIYAYFLATLAAHDFHISRDIRAVEGIAGSAMLYDLLGLLLICCLGGSPIASFIAIILDTAFLACFIYVAVANKHGAGNCRGEVTTPYGTGLATSKIKGKGRSIALLRYRVACQMETACLAAAVIAVIFFFFSILLDIALGSSHYKTNRKENKGYGYQEQNDFLGQHPADGAPDDLPEHVGPDDMISIRSNSVSGDTERFSHATSEDTYSPDYHHRRPSPSRLDPPYPV